MKWMYLEQETKETYLRAILCDPPTVIEQKDNDELGNMTRYGLISRSTKCSGKGKTQGTEEGS
jgi:hypothetical protein